MRKFIWKFFWRIWLFNYGCGKGVLVEDLIEKGGIFTLREGL